jgi:hypothetical protein
MSSTGFDRMKLSRFLTGTALALVPLASAAATLEPSLQLRVAPGTADEILVTDNGMGDGNMTDGILSVANLAASGYEFISTTAIRQPAPPRDQLLVSVDAYNAPGGDPAKLALEVTGHFSNATTEGWLGNFTASANDATGSDWVIESWIGDSAFARGALALERQGALFAVSNLMWFDPTSYWITHVFGNEAEPGTATSADADYVGEAGQPAVVPLPAGGFLLIGAVGGLAAMRRRLKA